MIHQRRNAVFIFLAFIFLAWAWAGLAPLHAQAPTLTVQGTVEAPDGSALAGARAELRRLAGNVERTRRFLDGVGEEAPLASASATDDGRFTLSAPEAGVYTVTVRAPGYVPMTYAALALTEPRRLPSVTLTADVGARVDVRATGGEPIGGAWILARPSAGHAGAIASSGGWRTAHRMSRTPSGGRVDLPRAPGERLDVSLFVPGALAFAEQRGVERAAAFDAALPSSPGDTLVIEIRRPGGDPVLGAIVALGERIWPVGSVDGVGRLELRGALRFPLQVHVLGPRGAYRFEAVEASPAVVTLAEPLALTGRALREAADGSRRPHAGALVWPASDPGSFVRTDERGRFTLPLVRGRGGVVRAEAAGFLPLAFPARRSEATLLLRPGLRAVGRVVGPEERPLADVRVAVRPADREHAAWLEAARWVAHSGPDGRFEIVLPASKVDVTARRPGFAPTRVRGIEVARSPAPADLGTLILEPGAAIRGRVVDSLGEGVAGASVWMADDLSRPATELAVWEPATPANAVTDGDGAFTLEDLQPGARFHLLVRSAGCLPSTVEAVTAPAAGIDVRLETGGRIRGRVVDAAREGVADAVVQLRPAELRLGSLELPLVGEEHHKSVPTDADGRFEIPSLSAGRFEVSASAEGYLPGEAATIELAAADERDGVVLTLTAGAVVTGRVTTSSGEAVAGARIRVEGAGTAESGHDGVYRVRGAPLGRRTVRAHHPVYRFVEAEVEVEEGETALDLEFAPGQPIAGRVVDGEGRPVEGASLELRELDPEDPHLLRATSAPDGVFDLPEVADGRYRLSAERPGYGWIELDADVVVEGRPVDELEVALDRAGAVVGQVVGLDFDELAGLEVVAEHDGRPPRRGEVDYQGAYRVDELAPGDWLIRARSADGRREARARVVLDSGAQLRRDLELGGGFVLEGQVLFAGAPLSGARISVAGRDVTAQRTVRSDHEGRFRIDDLAGGLYHVGVSHPREVAIQNREVRLDGDRSLVIEIETARVYGRVALGDGAPGEGSRIRLQQLLVTGREASVFSVPAGAGGDFAIPRITAGRFRLTVSRDGYETVEEELEIQAGVDLGPLDYELKPAAGLVLRVVAAAGELPPYVDASFTSPEGGRPRHQGRSVDADGIVRFPSVPAGDWDVLVSAPGRVASRFRVSVPGKPVELVLASASRLRIRVPALVESEAMARVRLVGSDGGLFRGLSGAGTGDVWNLAAGTAEIPGVPPGNWTVRVEAPNGQSWTGAVATDGEPEVLVNLGDGARRLE